MTGNELHKLKRQDLLKLLLAQAKESENMHRKYDAAQAEIKQLNAGADRLKTRLDEKDALINKLKARLDKKDQQIRDLRELIERRRNSRDIRLTEAGSIAQAALQLNGVFEAAQQAADQYIYNLQQMQQRIANGQPPLPEEESIPQSVLSDEGDDELRAMLQQDARRNARAALIIQNPDESAAPAPEAKPEPEAKPAGDPSIPAMPDLSSEQIARAVAEMEREVGPKPGGDEED